MERQMDKKVVIRGMVMSEWMNDPDPSNGIEKL
jgi:hypothetical protein